MANPYPRTLSGVSILYHAGIRIYAFHVAIAGNPGYEAKDPFYVSDWQSVEFASSLARRVRMRSLPPDHADTVFDSFRQWQSETCRILAPDVIDYEHAAAIIRNYETGLRSGDALHLAVAHNNAIPEIVTLDRGMARAATMLGLSVATP